MHARGHQDTRGARGKHTERAAHSRPAGPFLVTMGATAPIPPQVNA